MFSEPCLFACPLCWWVWQLLWQGNIANIHLFTHFEKLWKVSSVMSFSCGLLFDFYTNKLKKFSIGFKSGLFGEVLNTGSPTRAAAHRAVIVFCLRHLSIKNLFSTGFMLLSNAKWKLESAISANLVPVIGPKYCLHRTALFLYEIQTKKFEFKHLFFYSTVNCRIDDLIFSPFSGFRLSCLVSCSPFVLESFAIFIKWNLIIPEFLC